MSDSAGKVIPFWEWQRWQGRAVVAPLDEVERRHRYATSPVLEPVPPAGSYDPRTYSPVPALETHRDHERGRHGPMAGSVTAGNPRPVGQPPLVGDQNRLRHRNFPVRTRDQATAAEPGVVISGVRAECQRDHGFVVNTLYVGSDQAPASGVVVVAGFLTWEVRGLHPGGPWIRRFCTAPGQQVRIRCETFLDVDVELLNSTAAGLVGQVIASEAISAGGPGPLDYAWLAVIHAAAGTFVRPYGATHVVSSAADAGFVWNVGGAGLNVTIPEGAGGLAAGVEVETKGPEYTTTVFPISLVWRIAL